MERRTSQNALARLRLYFLNMLLFSVLDSLWVNSPRPSHSANGTHADARLNLGQGGKWPSSKTLLTIIVSPFIRWLASFYRLRGVDTPKMAEIKINGEQMSRMGSVVDDSVFLARFMDSHALNPFHILSRFASGTSLIHMLLTPRSFTTGIFLFPRSLIPASCGVPMTYRLRPTIQYGRRPTSRSSPR